MENLISLIIDLLSSLFGPKEDQQKPPANRPDPSRPRPQPGPASWENELRRLLDNQAPPPSAPQAAPPPLDVRPRIITVQPPRPVPVLIETPPARVRPVLVPPPLPPGIQPTRPLASLTESQQAYARASQLDKSAAARIERVPGQAIETTTVTHRPVSPEVMQVIALFKNPEAARQAVIATVIFGPPRAFDEQTRADF